MLSKRFLRFVLAAILPFCILTFSQKPVMACLTPWTDNCDWIDDDVLPEAGDTDEAILPKFDGYVSNYLDEPIEITIWVEFASTETTPSSGEKLGTWVIEPNTFDKYILDNASTGGYYSALAVGLESGQQYTWDETYLSGIRRYTWNLGR